MNKLIKLASFTCLALTFNSAYAETFSPPEQIVMFDREYRLNFKHVARNGWANYEYTTNGETVKNWTTLVTINYAGDVHTDPDKWQMSMKTSLDRHNPPNPYKLYVKGESGFARIIYEPNRSHPAYESNVQKSFHVSSCGLVVLQFATKYQGVEKLTDAEKISLQDVIKKGNEDIAHFMEQNEWKPSCI